MATKENPNKYYAVVAIGGVFPDAPDTESFWRNIVAEKVSIKPVSEKLLPQALYKSDCYGKAEKRNKSYTKIGAVIDSIPFNSLDFKIPPSVARHMDDGQKIALIATKEAMESGTLDSIAKDKVSVVMGGSGHGPLMFDHDRGLLFDHINDELNKALPDSLTPKEKQEVIEGLRERCVKNPVDTTEDSAPGTLPSIVASRINSVFDFHGRTMVLDAACASGLAAISTGIDLLQKGESDAVICGAVDQLISQTGMVLFSGINALSPDGSYPFDQRANGFVIGQGGGVCILKRLPDAIDYGDEILAVVTATSVTTDGKGKAIAAPNHAWQAKAISQAYKRCGYSLDTVELIEAHGTATQVGDKSEVFALKQAFEESGSTKIGSCGLSSVKSNIGHLKSAAGIAGFIKAVLAIKHKTLPPVAGFQKENPALELSNSPLYIIDQAQPWLESSHPRRAGVSAFGFGGINYHIALQEFRSGDYSAEAQRNNNPEDAVRDLPVIRSTGDRVQIMKISGDSLDQLKDKISALAKEKNPESLSALMDEYHSSNVATAPYRLGITAQTREELMGKLSLCHSNLQNKKPLDQLFLKGIYFSDKEPISRNQIACVFPGQGSQYPQMLRSLAEQVPSFQNTLHRADLIWKSCTGTTISSLLYGSYEQDKHEAMLKDTANTHPAMYASSYAIYHFFEEMGLEADYYLGHSLGELVALTAAGALHFKEGLPMMQARATSFTSSRSPGSMVGIAADKDKAQELIEEFNQPLYLSNFNSPQQSIISGTPERIEAFMLFVEKQKIRATILPVNQAFHSPLVKDAAQSFSEHFGKYTFRDLKKTVISNETAQPYPSSGGEVQKQLANHIVSPVQFINSIKYLCDKGVKLFIEMGPGSVLTNNIKNIVSRKDITLISTNSKKGDDIEALAQAACQLFACGIDLEDIPFNRDALWKTASPQDTIAEPSQRGEESVKKRTVVYSGVSVGLPGSFKAAFRDDNFEQLFDGKNCIERLTDREKQSLVDLNITKLIKSEEGASFKELNSLNEVIQFVGKLGPVQFEKEFSFDKKELATMSSAVAYAIAAGYEALRDAHIPLVRQYNTTSNGSTLPDRWALPREMQKRTGVIFANGFPMIDPVIEEVSKHVSFHYGNKLRSDVFDFYTQLIDKVSHRESKKLLSDWYGLHHSVLSESPTSDELYRFNHHFMTQISAQANNRLARYINAQGPNFLLFAACSSTSTAVTLSEEMIQSGRVDRVIVIGADDTANKNILPYIGAGFLSTGAASNGNDLYDVALPFDKRRNGMVMGSGAVGIVVEAAEVCEKRGIIPVAELVGTHCFNTAGHANQLDIPVYAEELEQFIGKLESEKNLQRSALSKSMIYMSHEPYTPPRGGCSQSEAVALQHVFARDFNSIIVSNTKGMTGHTMGASIEDAVAAKCLQWGRVPPVVNHKEFDPTLQGLQLSRGESHQCSYALRMAAGFGSQGNYILLRKSAVRDKRIDNEERYKGWLRSVSHLEEPVLDHLGRMLIIRDTKPGTVKTHRPQIACYKDNIEAPSPGPDRIEEPPSLQANRETLEQILTMVSDVSGYPVEMLEPSMEFEADLGIDTVKQATILAMMAERWQVQADESFKVSEYPTPNHLLNLLNVESEASQPEKAPPLKEAFPQREEQQPAAPDPKRTLAPRVLEIISEVSGYPVEILELDMEFEADLGIDTVKQATILAMLSEEFQTTKEKRGFNISDYPTIQHLVTLFSGQEKPSEQILPEQDFGTYITLAEKTLTLAGFTKTIAEVSDYPPEMVLPEYRFSQLFGFDQTESDRVIRALEEQYSSINDFSIKSEDSIIDIVERFGSSSQDQFNTPNRLPHQLSKQIVELHRAALEKSPSPLKTPLKNILLIGQSEKWLNNFAQALQRENIHIERLVLRETSPRFKESKKYDTIIDLTLLGCTSSSEDLQDLIETAFLQRLSLYRKMTEKQWQPARIIACVALDEHFGLSPEQDTPLQSEYGAFTGFYKSLRKEWELRGCSIYDTGAHWKKNIPTISQNIYHELWANLPGIEISYPKNKRHQIVVVDSLLTQEKSDPLLSFTAEDTLLITGGGSGITREVVKGLSRVVATNFSIVGRTKLDPEALKHKNKSSEEWNSYRVAVANQLREQGQKASPKQIEQKISSLKKSLEIFSLIEEVRAAGCGIKYYSADITQSDEVFRLVETILEERPSISGVIHGAGIEISHLLSTKSDEEFFSVLSPKMWGALNIRKALKDQPLKRVLAFGSISGRFGNGAQLDYSAANAFLATWVSANRQRGIPSLCIDWSGWSDIGMAARNTYVVEHAPKSGLNLIPPAQGVEAAIQLFLNPNEWGEVILHKGLGPMYKSGMHQIDLSASPFIDRIDISPKKLICHRVFSPIRDQFLKEHRLRNTPLMPGVAYIEMMAEQYSLHHGTEMPIMLRDLYFLEANKFHSNESRELTSTAIFNESENCYETKISGIFKSKVKGVFREIDYASAKVGRWQTDQAFLDKSNWQTGPLTELSIKDIRKKFKEHPNTIHFGPLFHNQSDTMISFEEDSLKLNETCFVMSSRMPDAQIGNPEYPLESFAVNPCFLDNLHHPAAILAEYQTGEVFLPVGAEEFAILQVARSEGWFTFTAKFTKVTEDRITYNVLAQDESGSVFAYIRKGYLQRISQ
ncbi:MAG: SDR family NAD(P)-dependent oxidoreductase [Spirochaetales bacterium]|nr:SDR family NAD(P)-dependent oxidoreductase [Spirochaetales bacterium]